MSSCDLSDMRAEFEKLNPKMPSAYIDKLMQLAAVAKMDGAAVNAALHDSLAGVEIFTSKNRNDLNDLTKAISEELGNNPSVTDVEALLDRDEYTNLKYLLLKKQEAAAKRSPVSTPRDRTKYDLIAETKTKIAALRDRKQHKKAKALETALIQMERAKSLNEKMQRNFEEVNKLMQHKKVLKEFHNVARISLEDMNPMRDDFIKKQADYKAQIEALVKKRDLEITYLERAKKKIKEEIEKRNKAKGHKAKKTIQERIDKLRKQLAEHKAKIKGLNININRIQGLMKKLIKQLLKASEDHKESKNLRDAIRQVGYEIFNIDKKIMKAGFVHEGFIDHVISGDWGTSARQISADIQRAKIDNTSREKLLNTLYVDEKISRAKLASVLGSDFVMAKLDKEEASREEAELILDEFKTVNLNLASKKGYLISDLEFATTEALEAMADEAESSGRPIDSTNNDTIILPMISHARVVAESAAGTTPEAYADYTSEQIYKLLDKLLRKLHTIRYSPGYGKTVSSRHVQAVMADIVGLEHVNGLILFEKSLEWVDTSSPNHVSPADRVIGLKSTMQSLGYTEEQINNMPEVKDYDLWLNSDKSVSIDIETEFFTDGIQRISTVAIASKGKGNSLYETPAGGHTADSARAILEKLEQLQNQGYKVVTYNGNSFDIYRLGILAEDTNLAARVALRGIDLMQNAMAFNSFAEGSNSSQSQVYGINNLAKAFGFTDAAGNPLVKTDTDGGKMSGFWARIVHDEPVYTEEELVKAFGNDQTRIDRAKEELNISKAEAAAKLKAYAQQDAELNLILLHGDNKVPGMLDSAGATVAGVTTRGARRFDIRLEAVAPTWNLTGQQTHDFAIKRGMGKFGTMGGTISNTLEAAHLASVDVSAETQIDVDGAIQTVMTLMVRAKAIDPETTEFARALVKLADETVTPREASDIVALERIGAHREALQSLQQEEVVKNTAEGKQFPLRFGANGEVVFASLETGVSTTVELQDVYEGEAIDGFKQYLKEKKRTIAKAAEQVNFRKQKESEQDENYLKELLIYTVNKYSFYGVTNIYEFGNGMVDYAPAFNVGMGLAQIIFNQREGTIARPQDKRMLEESYKFDKTTKSEDRKLHLSMKYGVPSLEDIHHAMPRSLNQIESAFRDFRLRGRMSHILNHDIKTVEEAREIIAYYEGKTESENEVIGRTRTPMPDLYPNVTNRLPWNALPNIDQQRALVLESMLEMPQLLQMWQHDSVTLGGEEKIYLDEDVASRYYADNALSAGSLTGSAFLSGLGPQVAWKMMFPVMPDGAIEQSIERGIAAVKKHGDEAWSKSNYFDYKFNGLHHFLALRLQYDPNSGRMENLLKDLGVLDNPEDVYVKALDLLDGAVSMRLKTEEDVATRKKLEYLQEFLASDKARDAMKTQVIPVLYSGGIEAARSQLDQFMVEESIGLSLDAQLVTEMLFHASTVNNLSLIDKAIGISKEKRAKLIEVLQTEMQPQSSGASSNRMKEFIKTNFRGSTEPKLDRSSLRTFLNERIRYMANVLTAKRSREDEGGASDYDKRLQETVKEITKEFQERIDKSMAFVADNDMSLRENKRQVNIILSGNEEAYKQQSTLASLNAMQNTPFTMRTDQIDKHIETSGRYIDPDDFLGFQNQSLYFTVGQDSSGHRLYYGPNSNYAIQPQNSSMSSVHRHGTPGGKDDNPHAMWSLKENNLHRSSNPEADVEKLLARGIALRMSPSYAPTQMGYDMESTETEQNFWNEIRTRDEPETAQFRTAHLKEQELIEASSRVRGGSKSDEDLRLADQLKQRKKNGTLLRDAHRFLLDPTRDRTGSNDASYIPGSETSLKGLAAFRPELADIPWAERGIMTLGEIKQRRDILRNREGRVDSHALSSLPSSPSEIIPKESQGWKNPYEGSSSPYVPEAPIDFVSDAIQGNISLRIQRRASAMKPRLEEFAIRKGLQHLLGEKPNWTQLYVLRELERKTIQPLLEGFRGLDTVNDVGEKDQANKLNMERIAKITSMFQFHNDVGQTKTNLATYGRELGFSPEELADKDGSAILYVDFLALLARKGIDKLSPLVVNRNNEDGTYNIPLEGNLKASGLDTTLSDTKTTPLTVQNHDSAQVLFTLLYQSEGRKEATEYLKKTMSDEGFAALEKDPNGFVLLSSVPPSTVDEVLAHLLSRPALKNYAIRNMGLAISFDTYAGNAKLTAENTEVDLNAVLFPNLLLGPRYDYSSDKGGLRYLNNEMLNHVLIALSNDVTNRNAELVSMTGAQFGEVKSDSMQIADAHSRQFYEMQRDAYADEMDMLTFLHSQSNSPRPRYVENPALSDEYGLPLAVYDPAYYLNRPIPFPDSTTGALSKTGFEGTDEAWVGYIRESAFNLERLGMTEEANVLKTFLDPWADIDYKVRQALVIIAETANSREDARRKLSAFLPHLLTKNNGVSIDAIMEVLYRPDSVSGISPVEAYQIGISRINERNDFVSSATRYAEQNGEIDTAALHPAYLAYLRVTDPYNPTPAEATKARVAARRANSELNIIKDESMYGGVKDDLALVSMMDASDFMLKFNHVGSEINAQIESLIVSNAISGETANFYRAMLGMILAHDNSFLDGVTFTTSETTDRKGSVVKYGNKYTLNLNPGLLARVSAPEAARVFAHELVHIARLKYMATDSSAWYGLRQIYQSESGKQAMSDLLLVMSNNDVTKHAEDVRYYTQNPDEFIAEFGAYFLLARATNNVAVLTEIERLRTASPPTDTMLSWWERAFKYIKDFGSRLTSRLAIVKQQNPDVYDHMLKITDQLFNFDGASPVTNRKNVDNKDGTFNVAKSADIAPDVDLTDLSVIQQVAENHHARIILTNKDESARTAEEETTLNELNEQLAQYDSGRDKLGMTHSDFAVTIYGMVDSDGKLNPYRNDTPKEAQARASYVLRKVGKIRGDRVDSKGTPAGLIRSVFGEDAVNTVQKLMFTNSNQSDLTWNSDVEVLASLAWLLNTTKATTENSFVLDSSKGLIPNKNKIEQLSSSVTRAVNMVRAKHDKESGIVEEQAIQIIQKPTHEKPSNITDDQWKDATSLARVYRANHLEFVRIAEEAGIRPKDRESNDFALRLNKDHLTKEPGKLDEFQSALIGLQAEKLTASLTDTGIIDPTLIYMSAIIPRYQPDERKLEVVTNDYEARQNKFSREGTTAESIMHGVVEKRAFDLYVIDRNRSTTGTLSAHKMAWDLSTETRALYFNKALPKFLYELRTKSVSYNSLITDSSNRAIVFDHLRSRVSNNRNVVETQESQNRYHDLNHGLSKSMDMRGLAGNVPYRATNNPTAANVKVGTFMGRVGNSTFVPFLDSTNDIQVADIYDTDRPDSNILRDGFSTDIKQIIKGTQLGLGGRGFVELEMEKLVGVSMPFETLLTTIERLQNDTHNGTLDSADDSKSHDDIKKKRELILRGLRRLKRIHDVSMGVAERYEDSGRMFPDLLAKYGPNILTLVWGPNLNAASTIFEAQLSAINTTIYGGNPIRMYKNLLGNTFKLMWSLRNGSDSAVYDHKLRALGDALYDTNNNVRLLMENGAVEDNSSGGWMSAIRTYQNVSALAIRMSMMEEGNKFLISNFDALSPLLDWASTDETPKADRDRSWYVKMLKEAGPSGLRSAMGMGFRPEIVQIMHDSELLTKDMVNMLGYVLNSEEIPLVSGMVDLTSLRTWIEADPNATITIGTVEYSRRQFWDLAGNIESFNNEYANLGMVQSDPMDRDVDKNTAWYLLALYRSFPNLFAMQHVMRSGAREGMVPYAIKGMAAVVLDLIYNLFLASLYGLITLDDLNRWRKGDMTMEDAIIISRMAARSPFLGIRGNMAASGLVGAIGSLSGASSKTGWDKDLLYAPLMAIAGIRLAENFAKIPKHAIGSMTGDNQSENQEKLIRNLVNTGRKFLPVVNDSILTALQNQAFPPPETSSNKSKRGGNGSGGNERRRNLSPYIRTDSLSDNGDDQIRGLFNEMDSTYSDRRLKRFEDQSQIGSDPGLLPEPTVPENSTTPPGEPGVTSPPSGGTPMGQTTPSSSNALEGPPRASTPSKAPEL